MKLIKGYKYLIEWLDAFGDGGWYSEQAMRDHTDNILKSGGCVQSIGFFIQEYKGFVILAADKDATESDTWGNPNFIPRILVKKIKLL